MSVGHKIGLETAVSLTHACCLYRIPEPIRQVRNLRIENILSCELLLVVTMSLFSDTFCLKIPSFFFLIWWQWTWLYVGWQSDSFGYAELSWTMPLWSSFYRIFLISLCLQADIRSREYLRQHYTEELKNCSCITQNNDDNAFTVIQNNEINQESLVDDASQAFDELKLS